VIPHSSFSRDLPESFISLFVATSRCPSLRVDVLGRRSIELVNVPKCHLTSAPLYIPPGHSSNPIRMATSSSLRRRASCVGTIEVPSLPFRRRGPILGAACFCRRFVSERDLSFRLSYPSSICHWSFPRGCFNSLGVSLPALLSLVLRASSSIVGRSA